jgi:5-methylcytosine-specific restriction endonuclease McrA
MRKHNIRGDLQKLVLQVYNYTCVLCADAYGASTIDHIVPISKGGKANDLGNIVVLCYTCNHLKADSRLPYADEQRLLAVAKVHKEFIMQTNETLVTKYLYRRRV